MKYRLAGASYRAIAEKLTEDRAREYADANGVSLDRAMKKFPHVSKRTVWEDVTAEMEALRRETEVQRSDLMALENARLDQYAGIGLIAGGVLLATLWADTPVAESLTGSKALGHVRVGHRVAFARALLTGQAAQEYDPGSKAAADVEHLHVFIMKHVHSLTPSQSGVVANG